MTYDVILFTDLGSRFWHAKPVGAYRIASELRNNGYSVKVIDFAGDWFTLAGIRDLEKILKKLIGDNTLFVGFSSTFFGIKTDATTKTDIRSDIERTISPWPAEQKNFDLWCMHFKKKWPHVKLVYGGSCATTNLNLNSSFDYMVLGLADNSVVELASHLKFKTPLRFNLIGKPWKVIDHDVKGLSFNFPTSSTTYCEEDHIFPNEVLAIEISRGCMFKCSFCAYPLLGRGKGNPDYKKEISILADEFKRNWDNHKTTKYFLVDDTFNETTEKIQAVIEATKLAGVKIEAFAYVRIDILEKYPEQIKLIKELGIRSVYFGIESLNDASARSIGKGLSSERVKATLHRCREEWGNEVAIHTNFIVGLPYDTPETITEWAQWVLTDSPADSSMFYPLSLTLDRKNVDSSVFYSQFAINAEKYGYKEYKSNWKNDVWNFEDATVFANNLNQQLVESGKMKLAGMDIIGLMNFGYEFHELKGTPYKNLDKQILNSKYNHMFEQYKKILFEYEDI